MPVVCGGDYSQPLRLEGSLALGSLGSQAGALITWPLG